LAALKVGCFFPQKNFEICFSLIFARQSILTNLAEEFGDL